MLAQFLLILNMFLLSSSNNLEKIVPGASALLCPISACISYDIHTCWNVARAFLEQCSDENKDSTPLAPANGVVDSIDAKSQNVNVLVTSGSLIPSLVKCLLFRLDNLITHGNGQHAFCFIDSYLQCTITSFTPIWFTLGLMDILHGSCILTTLNNTEPVSTFVLYIHVKHLDSNIQPCLSLSKSLCYYMVYKMVWKLLLEDHPEKHEIDKINLQFNELNVIDFVLSLGS